MNFSYFFEITFGRHSNTVERFTMPDRATYARGRPSTPSAGCRSCCGRCRRRDLEEPDVVPGHLTFLDQGTVDDEITAGREHGEKLLHRGPFMMRSPFGRPTTGEPISSSETTTVQFAVPPRISTPYAGK